MNLMADTKLINDYINGNDIENYTLDELENNSNFMLSVIKYTQDKRIYNLCSNKLKNDYEFIKEIILFFKDDFKFINKVAGDFIDNNKYKPNVINITDYLNPDDKTKETEIFELCIIMSRIYKKYYPDEFNKYAVNVTLFKESSLIENEIILRENKNELWVKDLGLGFKLCALAFQNSEEILKVFIDYYLNELFFVPDMESLLHKKFINKEEFINYGINNYIINHIKKYDEYLAYYITKRLYLTKDIKKDIDKIIYNWDKYNYNIEKQKYDLFMEKLLEYKEENFMNMLYSLDELIDFIKNNLGLEDIFNKYYIKDYIYSEEDKYYDSLFNRNGIKLEKMNEEEIKCIRYVYSLAKRIFNKKIELDEYSNVINIKSLRKVKR
ncbi:MAG: hypothetical protein IJD92_03780 [Bacilli bacterium]|nr:hypothetical protein [Bacilli bacterium]